MIVSRSTEVGMWQGCFQCCALQPVFSETFTNLFALHSQQLVLDT